MAHDLKAFEGDWWLLIEEEPLEELPEQKLTLRHGRVIRYEVDAGDYRLDGDDLVITLKAAHGLTETIRACSPAGPGGPLSGNIHGPEFSEYCALLRGDQWVSESLNENAATGS